VEHFAAAIRDRRYANEAAARYGLVTAHLRAGQTREAQSALAALRATGAASPMIETLQARVQRAAGDAAGALATLGKGQQRYPGRLSLAYAYVEALEQAGRPQEAMAALAEPMRLYPRDAKLRAMQARIYAALGRRLLQHQAQAEVYLLRGSLPAAIEQLQLAQAAGDGNFYELSVVEARLKELRAQHTQEMKDAKQQR
jgi:predicted Zn-dependent protease